MVQHSTATVVAAVALLVALSGCLTVGMGVDATVGSDGVIERYELQMNVSGQGYTMMKSFGQSMGDDGGMSQGFENLERSAKENVTDEFERIGEVETNVTETSDRLTLTVVLHDAVPKDGGNISVTTEGDRLVYRDALLNRSFGDAGPSVGGTGGQTTGDGTDDGAMSGDMGGMMEDVPEPELHLTYELEMPGEIEDANADEIDGNVARWNRTYSGDEMDEAGFVVEAESRTGGGSMPGFGAVAAALAVLAGSVLIARRRR